MSLNVKVLRDELRIGRSFYQFSASETPNWVKSRHDLVLPGTTLAIKKMYECWEVQRSLLPSGRQRKVVTPTEPVFGGIIQVIIPAGSVYNALRPDSEALGFVPNVIFGGSPRQLTIYPSRVVLHSYPM